MAGTPNSLARVIARCEPDGDCLLWTGYRTPGGYGMTTYLQKAKYVHRFVWEQTNGPIPEGMTIDHLCGNPACCEITHLRMATHRENILASNGPAAINARRTECVNGHPLSGDNLYLTPDKKRRCRTCVRRRTDEWRKRQALGV